MDVAKLRISVEGLTPVGTYFQRIAAALSDANEREAERRLQRDAEDRALERRFAKKPLKRAVKRRAVAPMLRGRAASAPDLRGSPSP